MVLTAVSMKLGILALLVTLPALSDGPEVERARQLYARTSYREALQAVAPLAGSKDPGVHEISGKSWFALSDYRKAQDSFEKAVAADPANGSYHHWLGKAYGRRAETSNPFSAPMLASKARQNFEKAVQLDGRNLEAVNDLFTYYLEAPGFLGGGIDKAENLARRIESLDKVEGHYARAQIAEKRKEFKAAEFHFRQAFQMAPKSVGRAIDLARFLAKQGRLQESEAVFTDAAKIAPDTPRLLFEHASALVRAKQNLAQARAMLEKYLRLNLTPDDPPRSEAERLLKQT